MKTRAEMLVERLRDQADIFSNQNVHTRITLMLREAADAIERECAELNKARKAIMQVLGNGCDEEAWPPGVHYADALGPYVDRLCEPWEAALKKSHERIGRLEAALRRIAYETLLFSSPSDCIGHLRHIASETIEEQS